MSQVVIENPILNSPFEAPRRHFKFTDDGITDEVVERRPSSYFIPILRPRKQTKQLTFGSGEEQRQSDDINSIRSRVGLRRRRGYRASPRPPARCSPTGAATASGGCSSVRSRRWRCSSPSTRPPRGPATPTRSAAFAATPPTVDSHRRLGFNSFDNVELAEHIGKEQTAAGPRL